MQIGTEEKEQVRGGGGQQVCLVRGMLRSRYLGDLPELGEGHGQHPVAITAELHLAFHNLLNPLPSPTATIISNTR